MSWEESTMMPFCYTVYRIFSNLYSILYHYIFVYGYENAKFVKSIVYDLSSNSPIHRT